MRNVIRRWSFMSVTAALGLVLAGCLDTETIYVDRPLFEEPAEAAGGFLGYSRQREKMTTCGNCHVGQQRQWEATSHAHAWASLASSDHAQPQCEGCHTVSSFGNAVTRTDVGWMSTGDPRYRDVQCESCHGPGFGHVQLPDDRAASPIASLAVSATLGDGCGQCHTGAFQPYVEEWLLSGHGRVIAPAVAQPACVGCHGGQAALQAWGVDVRYREKHSSTALAITCGICHDPHSGTHAGQLRFAVDVLDRDANLCIKCHQHRSVPDTAHANRPPHSPEGPMLLGEAGWWPPGVQPVVVEGTHTSEQNPRLCAGCHMNSYRATDEAGGFVRNVTGHVFEATPCVDDAGVPTGETCSLEQRSFRSCTGSGCHGSEAAARSIVVVVRQRLDRLTDELDALLARVPSSEFNHLDGRYTTAEGARFNSQLAKRPGSATHNPFLMEALLIASITRVRQEYGFTGSVNVSLEPELGSW